jgi:hypothetical protein
MQAMEHIMEARKRIKKSGNQEIRWIRPVPPDTVRPMFRAIYPQTIACASQVLNTNSSDEMNLAALMILTSTIEMSGRLFMERESILCLSALCTFTHIKPWAPLQASDIWAIQQLLKMTKSFLCLVDTVWEQILQILSNINSFMMIHNTTAIE